MKAIVLDDCPPLELGAAEFTRDVKNQQGGEEDGRSFSCPSITQQRQLARREQPVPSIDEQKAPPVLPPPC
jgi:hypothetical protein